MNLNDLLKNKEINPEHVLVLRHSPTEPEVKKVLPWLAAEKPEVFNAYQQTQPERLEKVMNRLKGFGYIASCIGHQPGKALFVGLYSIGDTRPLSVTEYWQVPACFELKAFGLRGFNEGNSRTSVLWFDLVLTDFYASWKGKMVISFPPPERAWWRRAHRNELPILSILEDSALDSAMPEWDEICFSWEQLHVLPSRWRTVLLQWRCIYYIYDCSDGKGYVGSAYSEANLYGRWMNYAAHGHGDNRLLKQRDPRNFRFSILQRVSPDTEATEIIRLESSWKERLHTRSPYGLNDN